MSKPFSNPLPIPVIGFCAYSGTGKTTLLRQLIPELKRRGLEVAVIKHAHHDFDIDIPGKDSYEVRKAGARQVLVASHLRWALITEDECDQDPELPHLLQQLDADKLDLVLVEGFKQLAVPKILLHRAALGKPLLPERDDAVLAIACCADTLLPPAFDAMPRLSLDATGQIADFVQAYVQNYARQWHAGAHT